MPLPLISVIVPVYKAEDYLERCVDSIRNQTYSNLEIILVDDGSPDRCGEMCDAYAGKDSRIRVFHKENGGQSSARNLALDNMTGDFVGFVDSDDWIEPDMYEKLYQAISTHDAQIAVCGLQCDHSDGKVTYFNPRYPNDKKTEIFTMEDALRELTYAEKITNSPCDKLFAKDVLRGLPMKEGIIYEDTEIMPFWLERASRITYTPVPYYHYIMTEESTTRGQFRAERFVLADVAWERVEHYQRKHPQLVSYALLSFVNFAFELIIASAGAADCAELRDQLIVKVRSINPKQFFSLLTTKSKLKYCLFRINTKLYTYATFAFVKIKRRAGL